MSELEGSTVTVSPSSLFSRCHNPAPYIPLPRQQQVNRPAPGPKGWWIVIGELAREIHKIFRDPDTGSSAEWRPEPVVDGGRVHGVVSSGQRLFTTQDGSILTTDVLS